MKGCSNKSCGTMRGGSNLAYDPTRTGPIKLADYPLAYTGSGGSRRIKKGGCGTCGVGMRGGGVPAPLVGQPWSGNPSSWPGSDPNSPHGGSHLELNSYKVQPQMNTIANRGGSFGPSKVGGGTRRRSRRHTRRHTRRRSKRQSRKMRLSGGAAGITGIFGGIGTDLTTAFNTLGGTAPPVNPDPWVQYTKGADNLGYLNNTSASRAPAVTTKS